MRRAVAGGRSVAMEATWRYHGVVLRATLALLVAFSACAPRDAGDGYRTWRTYLGDPGAHHYSSLDQIRRENVHELEIAWIYETGDATTDSQVQCNPIVIDGVLFGLSAQLKLFALDAATGEERWSLDPFDGRGSGQPSFSNFSRGVAYWTDHRGDERVFLAAGSHLLAVDARRGVPVTSFGDGGRVALTTGLGREALGLWVTATSPGIVYRDLLIIGGRVHEGPSPAAPGHVRAFDVRSGALVWVFRTIPQPGDPGAETWLEPKNIKKYAIGGANSWAGLTLDEDRGLVFVPTGSATFDFYGGLRPGDNLFANTLLALDARTGRRVWHQQLVRHDIWDRDLPAPPNLVTVERDARRVDAVAQITKSGHVWLFDRETGEALFPIDEREVPASDVPGEWTAPRQRLPAKPPPFARQTFDATVLPTLSVESRRAVEARLQGVRMGGQFLPPSTDGTVIFPGIDGGGEWGGAAFDPGTGWLFVNANEMPWILTLVDLSAPSSFGERLYNLHCALCHLPDRSGVPESNYPALDDLAGRLPSEEAAAVIHNGRGSMPPASFLNAGEVEALVGFLYNDPEATGVAPYARDDDVRFAHTGYNRFLDPEGYPAVKPPWGTLTAIDLNVGEIVWQVPLGEVPELTARGIPRTGTENYGGPLVTAAGLVFIAATKDERLRAFDKSTGEELWNAKLPFGGYATPSTYEVAGRQYLVIAAGGGKMGTPSGDVYVAFALPR